MKNIIGRVMVFSGVTWVFVRIGLKFGFPLAIFAFGAAFLIIGGLILVNDD